MDGLTKQDRYRVSPLATFDRAVETAGALRDLEVSPGAMVFELSREYGLTEAQAHAAIREARLVTGS